MVLAVARQYKSRSNSCIVPRLHVQILVANHPRLRQIYVKVRARGFDHSKAGFSTITSLVRSMRAEIKPVDWFCQSPLDLVMDRMHVTLGVHSATYTRLIGNNDHKIALVFKYTNRFVREWE